MPTTTAAVDVRTEFEEFFRAAYPWLASQLHAITGDSGSAAWAVDTAFDHCWQRWDTVRRLTDPLTWVRWTALRAAAQGRTELSFRRPVATPPIPTDTDDGVVIAALQGLPRSQRQAVVLHYMGDVPVEEIARRSGTTADAVDWLLDTGFDSLVELLGWPTEGPLAGPSIHTEGPLAGPSIHTEGPLAGPDDPGADDPGADDPGADDPRLDWTAEALGDTAMRLAAEVTVPDPASVVQRVALRRWARRAAPLAVSAACVSGIVVLAAQLGPAATGAPRVPTIYVSAPITGDGGGYARVQVPHAPDEPATEVGGGATPLPYLGMRILPVAQATVLEDFGVSAPPATDAGPRPATSAPSSRAGSTSGTTTSVRAAGSSATTSASPATVPGTAGTRPTTSSSPATSSGGSVRPTSTGPARPSPTTVPPATTPPGTTPPTTTAPTTTPPPSTAPPATTPPPVTTDPPAVTVTTPPPVVTTTTPPPTMLPPTTPVTTSTGTAQESTTAGT